MLISDCMGMKFPTEYMIRFFFKEGLHQRRGRVLELGCGNGNNLMLFYQYGWDTVGVEIEGALVEQGEGNFRRVAEEYGLPNPHLFRQCDMVEFVSGYRGEPFDVVLLPHSIYYLPYEGIEQLMRLFRERPILGRDSLLFLTVRTPEDYRYGRGKALGERSFRLGIEETGEKGCIVTFLSEPEILGLLDGSFEFSSRLVSRQEYENFQNGHLVRNCDITVWGKIDRTRG